MKAVMVAVLLSVAGVSSAQTPLMELATHPQCYIVGNTVLMRGAVVDVGTGEPISRAKATLEYGGKSIPAWTNSQGVWTATAPLDPKGGDVIESDRVMVPVLGSLVPVRAHSAQTASCHPARVDVGALEPVR